MTKEELKSEIYKECTFEMDNEEDKNLVKSIIDAISDNEFEPRSAVKKIDADKHKLFGNVKDVILYLSEFKDYELSEEWYDYENNNFVFSKPGVEEDDELICRLCRFVGKEFDRIEDEREELEALRKKKEELLKEMKYVDAKISKHNKK